MKNPTILKFGLMSLIFLQSIISYSQNLVSNVDRTDQALRTEKFLMGSFASNEQFGTYTNNETNKVNSAAVLENPVIPYAQLPYAGQVAECPNDGKKLPKLFLCGGNDSRPIDTKITDAKSIIWERFISGGSCVTVSNSDCANDNASPSCWVKVAEGKDYLANSAGQFRIKIIDNAGNPYTFYFNVYQNTLIPTAITKSDIIKNASGTCQIPGQIKVGGFGSGYEYSFTTTGAPGAWDVNNTFTTSTPGNYTAFIRIKGVVGSCEFKVLNQDIKSVTLAVSTEVVAPRCYNGKGSIKVIKNDNSKGYTFNIYKPASSTTRSTFYDVEVGKELEYTFKDLDPGTYRVETVLQETNCVVDNKTAVIIPNAPVELTATLTKKDFTPCNSGSITVTTGGGTYPFRFLVDIDGGGFVQNGTNVITTVKAGTYTINVIDANGCSVEKKITLAEINKPIYTITKTDGDCANPKGAITVNVIDANGFAMEASFNGGKYFSVPLNNNTGTTVYPNLDPENYIIGIRYYKSGVNSGNYCTDPNFPISIGLTTALTASVGVAELSGCGPVGNVKQGKVRITNAEGGVPLTGPNGPYLYSYDDRKTWVTDKEMYVDPEHIFFISKIKSVKFH